jgi:hypothetical protein
VQLWETITFLTYVIMKTLQEQYYKVIHSRLTKHALSDPVSKPNNTALVP